MCGILTIVNKKQKPVKTKILANMLKMIKHRGPDDEGFASFNDVRQELYYTNDTAKDAIGMNFEYSPRQNILEKSEISFEVLLGHRRLSILDLSELGHQPMNYKEFWIVFNGEIYNFEEIKYELIGLGYKFTTSTDTEVILKAYVEWGNECQNKFNGMWSIVIYNRLTQDMWISRDRFGIKPIYYYEDNSFLIFCSEIKQLVPLVDLKENYLETSTFLLLDNDESIEETSFKNVYRFKFAHSVKLNLKNLIFNYENYFTVRSNNEKETYQELKCREYSEQYFSLLKQSVELRLKSDVDVGISLSGGLDSSSIAYLINEIRGNSKYKMHSFSNIYKEKELSEMDESVNIDLICDRLNLIAHKSFAEKNNFIQLIKDQPYIYDLPNKGFAIGYENIYRLPKLNGVTVVLDGQGADELMAGYPAYWISYLTTMGLWGKVLTAKKNQLSINNVLKSIILQNSDILIHKKFMQIKGLAKKINLKMTNELSEYLKYRLEKMYFKLTNLNDLLAYSLQTNLVNLVSYGDKHSMRFSLETRFPFLDYRLVDFLTSLPVEYKLHNGHTKYIARKAFDGRLDNKIVWEKKKLGFPSPQDLWYKDPKIRKFIESELDTDISKDLLFEKKLILHFWRKHFIKIKA
jgi:asparagine synthase (glutamine-hydrolysing)